MVQPELKPCPFCGGKAQLITVGSGGLWDHNAVECEKCNIRVFAQDPEEEEPVIECWNRRVTPEKRTWTSVKEALPESDGLYLVLNESGDMFSLHYDPDIEKPEERFGISEPHFNADTLGYMDSEWIPIQGITHWMELPELPTETEQEDCDDSEVD